MLLLTPHSLHGLTLRNRVVMAPLTRDRAGEGNAPTELNATYYEQRASFGLIITEATPVMLEGHGYPATPGIYTPSQIAGWQTVTSRVHARGGLIFSQLWHCGRISSPAYQPSGGPPPSASAIPAQGAEIWNPDWSPAEGPVTPRAMTTAEIAATAQAYRQAVRNAREAGFDGVEIHSANGYLLNQFLVNGINHRDDEYGGSLENRCRFLLDVLTAANEEWPGRIAVRLSPSGGFNDVTDSDPHALYAYLITRLDEMNLAYLHIVEPRMMQDHSPETYALPLSTKEWRPLFRGTLISSGGHTRESANAVLESGQADLIAFGRQAIANPDLPERFKLHAPLNTYDRQTFYGGTEKGYTDYPFLETATLKGAQASRL